METVWDAANIVIGVASLAHNIHEGNTRDAIIDGLGLVVDVAAVAVPFVPGGVSSVIKAGRAARVVNRFADLTSVAGRFGKGNKILPSAAKVTNQLTQVADIPGIDKLAKRLGSTPWEQVKGYTFQLDFVAAHADNIAEIERALPGRRSIDAVMKDGTYVELKNYDWSKYSPSQMRQKSEVFIRQFREYQLHAENTKFIFNGSVPDYIRRELVDAGAIVEVIK